MFGISKLSKKIFGTHNDRKIKEVQPLIDKINALENEFIKLSDAEIKNKTQDYKSRFNKGETLDELLPEVFANAREAAKRTLGLRAYDVQLMGGIFLHQGNIAEMKTGEGKTLVGVFPVYLNALTGRGVHVVTVNDYLAARDAEWMGAVYEFLGLTTGIIVPNMSDDKKILAYGADVTYATNNELGFDYLRDNMKSELSQMAQRDHYFAIVDEVDSILIDEARTPLIISGPSEDRSELYITIDKFIPELSKQHYTLEEKNKTIFLTDEGNDFVEKRLLEMGVLPEGQSMYDPESTTIVHHINNALRAHIMFKKDKDYIVRDKKVVLIDEFTGRMMDGRRLSDGLHQAIEAKENADIQPENVTLASVTFQNYFRLYEKLSGMTGTAQTEAEEFAEIYNLGVVEIPTNKPIIRKDEHDAIYRTVTEKYRAVITEIALAYMRGQPTLVGTTSIEKSETLSRMLSDPTVLTEIASRLRRSSDNFKKDEEKEVFIKGAMALEELAKNPKGIPHSVLNARFHEKEAEIIANAGKSGAITIATNMAGRGTDIQLGGNVDIRVNTELAKADETADVAKIRADIVMEMAKDKQAALDAGGLFVLATERHESRRIDNQLRGRSGRQGDPGRSSFFLSLEDDLMRIFGSERLDSVLGKLGMSEGEAIIHPWVNKSLEKAQAKVEGHNFDIRKQLLKFDDVMNDQRKAIFEQRLEIMKAEDISEIVKDMRDEVIDDMVDEAIPLKAYADQWDIDSLQKKSREILNLNLPLKDWVNEEGIDEDDIRERLYEAADKAAETRMEDIGDTNMRYAEKHFLLQIIDGKWREHIVTLEHLRSVVGMRGYAQRDPLSEYKTEAFGLFESLLDGLRSEVTRVLSLLRKPTEEEQKQMLMEQSGIQMSKVPSEFDEEKPETWGDVSRNKKCPCGSGKKFKHCHGKL